MKTCGTCGAAVRKPNRHAAWHIDQGLDMGPQYRNRIREQDEELAQLRQSAVDFRDQLWDACGSNDYEGNSWAHALEMVRAMRKELDRTVKIRQAEFEQSYTDLQDEVRWLKLRVARRDPTVADPPETR